MNQFSDYIRYKIFVWDNKATNYYEQFKEKLSSNKILSTYAPKMMKALPGYHPVLVYACLRSPDGQKAEDIVRQYIKAKHPHIKNWRTLRRAMKQAVLVDDISLAEEIIEAARARNIKMPKAINRKLLLANKKFESYIESYRYSPKKKLIKKYYPEKYVEVEEIEATLFKDHRTTLLTTLGPGDEVCWSYLYSAILEDNRVNSDNITIIGDYRFESIFKRTYPEFTFIGSRRTRSIEMNNNYTNFNKLPDYRLHSLICNESEKVIIESEKVIFNLDLLWTYRSFLSAKKLPRKLLPDQNLLKNYKKRFSSDQRYIGICWRSGSRGAARDSYYVDIEELAPLFEINDITFVNLQYDDCSEELKWVNERYPGKILSFDDVDLYNDFESILAIMNCLEAVVSAPTIVAEFSAAAGLRTFHISNTRDAAGRILADKSDAWNPNVINVVGTKFGDKESLVNNLRHLLLQ